MRIILLSVAPHQCKEQTANELTNEMARFVEDNHLSYAVVGVMRDRKLVYAEELERKSDKDVLVEDPGIIPAMDVSHLLSCLTILNLEDDGFVDLDTTLFGRSGLLADVIGEGLTPKDERLRDVTLKQVMQQTVGWGVRDMKWMDGDGPSEAINKVANARMMWVPGAAYNVSVFNEYMMRLVVEVRTGVSYEAYVKEHILIPLGMFHTRIHHKNQPAQNVPKRVRDWTMPLLPSVWHTSVHDIVRLLSAIDGNKGIFNFNLEKLYLLYSRPDAPYPQSTRHWRSAGFFMNKDGSFWSESVTSNGHYLFIHNTGTELTGVKVKKTVGPIPTTGKTLTVIYVRGLTHKHFKPEFLNMFRKVTRWPDRDLMCHDLVDSRFGERGLRVKISEHNVKSYMNAVRHAGYWPTWISAYNIGKRTFFAVIIRKVKALADDQNWIFEHGLKIGAFQRRVKKYEQDDIELQLTQAYKCYSHDEVACHFIFLRPKVRTDIKTETFYEKFSAVDDHVKKMAEQSFKPVIMSVLDFHGKKLATTVYRGSGNDDRYNWSLSLDQNALRAAVRHEASNKSFLQYLNAYVTEGETRFVAGFKHDDETQDRVLEQVDGMDDVKTEVDRMIVSKYFPKLLVAFPDKEKTNFFILYTRE